MFQLVVVTALVNVALCGPGSDFLGRQLTANDAPSSASVWAHNRHICGGTLIGDQHVLTTCYCTIHHEGDDKSVKLGITDTKDPGYVVEVNLVVQHPKFNNKTGDHALCILKLSNKVMMSSTIKAARFGTNGNDYEPQTQLSVYGYGPTPTDPANTKLHGARITVLTNAKCKEKQEVGKEMFCSLGIGNGPCMHGDEGVGVFNGKNELVGVYQFTRGDCGISDFPSVYSKIASDRDWVLSNL